VDIRNTHGTGNYIPRDLEKEVYIFERDKSAIVALSNRLDAGFDSRTVQTDFAPGTPLIELTGNANDPALDPNDDIPGLVVVNGDGTVNLRVPRNTNPNGTFDGKGYVIYGPSGPQGHLSLTNVDHTIPGETPTADTNGTARLASIPVITANSFQVELDTNAVNLLGSYPDPDANGDNALIKIDAGIDVNGNGVVDFTQPGSVVYGFEQFTDVHSPGYFNADGNGRYVQTIDATKLSEGMHYITVRAFRHRSDGGPAVFTDFRIAVYIDRTPTVSAVVSFDPIVTGVNENRRVTVRSTDLEANNVHVFLDLPAGLSNSQILGMVGSGSQSNQIDRDLWTRDFTGLTNGNHVLTVVSYELSGNVNIQRFPGYTTSTIFGAGLGDVNFDGHIDATDVNLFGNLLASNNSQFNPAADLNGDGVIDNTDLLLLRPLLVQAGADAATMAAYNALLGLPAAGFTIHEGDALSLSVTQPSGTTPALSFQWDVNNDGNFGDAGGPTPTLAWAQLVALGISDNVYPLTVRVGDGAATLDLTSTLTVLDTPPTIALGGNSSVNEGSSYTLTLGTVTDPGMDTITAYTVHWGDGLSDTYTTPGAKTHTYADGPLTASIAVDLTDPEGVHPGAGSLNLTVNDVPPTIALSGPSFVVAGSPYTLTLGAITDPGQDTVTSYIVHWGDGNSDTFTTAGDKTHTYTTPSPAQSITVDLVDEDGTHTGAGSRTVAVTSPPPEIDLTGAATTPEGSPYTLTLGAILDPGLGTITSYVVHWGDGFTDTYGSNGAKTHTYADGPATPTIHVDLVDGNGLHADAAQKPVTVNDVPPTIALSGAASANEGSPYTLTLGAITDPGQDTVTSYVVHWGDGGADTFSTAGAHTHTYVDESANLTITVDLVDEDGTHTGAGSQNLTVNDVPPTIALSGAASVNEGSPYTVTLGTITDPGQDTVTSYIVHWGDGSSDTFTNAGAKTHTYTGGTANPTITVDLIDEDGTHAQAGSLHLSVFSVPPVPTVSGGTAVANDGTYTLSLGANGGTVLQWVIDWGDGQVETVPGNATSAAHQYGFAPVNSYVLHVSAADNTGLHPVGTLTVMASPANRAALFVDRVTQELLGHHADAASLAKWTGQLQQGMSRSAVVLGIAQGPEYQTKLVNDLYRQNRHRPATAAELRRALAFFRHRGTALQLRAKLFGKKASNKVQVVQTYEQRFLGQPASGADLARLQGLLKRSKQDQLLIADILGSDAYLATL
jgi:hypothetical protein